MQHALPHSVVVVGVVGVGVVGVGVVVVVDRFYIALFSAAVKRG